MNMNETTPTYTGDCRIIQDADGNYDLSFINGQPEMTDFMETTILLAIFTEPDTWQNDIAQTPDEEYISTFPAVIARATVNDTTLKDGETAINNALAFLLKDNAVSGIIVTGEILSVYGIGWQIFITRPDGTESKYNINWDKGELSFQSQGV
jgi:hypothetical protein